MLEICEKDNLFPVEVVTDMISLKKALISVIQVAHIGDPLRRPPNVAPLSLPKAMTTKVMGHSQV